MKNKIDFNTTVDRDFKRHNRTRRFNRDVFIMAAECVDSGSHWYEYSCNAIYFINAEQLQEHREKLGIEPLTNQLSDEMIEAHRIAYAEFISPVPGRRIYASAVKEADGEYNKGRMRNHRVLMLLLAAEALGGKQIPSRMFMEQV